MPELPEVETTCRGITPHILNESVLKVIIRAPKLRWPIPKSIAKLLPKQKVISIERRAKYILIKFKIGTLIIHLGMSGRLQILSKQTPAQKHDHVDIIFSNGVCMRYTDPRRFGCILWTIDSPMEHKLLCNLGPEPFTKEFTGKYLYKLSQKRAIPVKNFIMDNKIVVGAGNIYANEALFAAKLDPRSPAKTISEVQYTLLVKHIKRILKKSIAKGGTTLKDFRDTSGKPGYFSQSLLVYGRNGEACVDCETQIEIVQIGQRSTFFCPSCQK